MGLLICSGTSMGDWRRHAIYFAPPAGSALARFGADWLGWDPEAGERRGGSPLPGLPLAARRSWWRRRGATASTRR